MAAIAASTGTANIPPPLLGGRKRREWYRRVPWFFMPPESIDTRKDVVVRVLFFERKALQCLCNTQASQTRAIPVVYPSPAHWLPQGCPSPSGTIDRAEELPRKCSRCAAVRIVVEGKKGARSPRRLLYIAPLFAGRYTRYDRMETERDRLDHAPSLLDERLIVAIFSEHGSSWLAATSSEDARCDPRGHRNGRV